MFDALRRYVVYHLLLTFFFRANLVQGGAPGTQFGRGSHTIVYTASDKTGATTYCSFSFKITGKSSLISNNNVCYQSRHSYCRLFSSGESQNFTCSFDVRSNPVAIAWVRSMWQIRVHVRIKMYSRVFWRLWNGTPTIICSIPNHVRQI